MEHTYELSPTRAAAQDADVEVCTEEEAEQWSVYKRPVKPDSVGHRLAEWVADFALAEKRIAQITVENLNQGPQPGKFFNVIAGMLQAKLNCEATGNIQWRNRHGWRIEELVKEHAPSGSGFDNGTRLNFAESKPEKLVFDTSFHHMNDGGVYDGWTDHKVIVTASLVHDYDIRVTGRDRNGIKDFIGETFATLSGVKIEKPYHEKAA